MSIQTLTLDGKKFVIMPAREYHRLQRQVAAQTEQDRGDVAEARRRGATGVTRAYSQVRKKLGLRYRVS
jgi:hypothetical protein